MIEADRAEIVTESYRQTEDEPIIMRRAKAFQAICEKLPIVIRPLELIVGSNAIAPRGCRMFPENYKTLVVRVAGYSALFTTLSKSLQDDIIKRTEQGGL